MALAALPRRSRGGRAVTIPGHSLQTSNTLLAAYAGLTASRPVTPTRPGWNLAASADRGGVRLYAILLGAPDEAHRDRDVARLLDWGFDRFKRAPLVRAGQRSATRATIRVVAARGLAAARSRASRCTSGSCCRGV